MAVQQAVEGANSCWLTDGGRYSGNGKIGLTLYIHTLILNEL
jgi:hypothetical protein